MASAADEGGAGGKVRRKPMRRASSATPYDRPASALRNNISIASSSSESGTNGWLSRIIARGAQRIFSSVFRKGLPAPQTVSEANHETESRDELPVAVSFNPLTVQDKVSDERSSPTNRSDPDSIDDLEKILKQKTFTRAEIDRLTELLRSRTVDVEGHQKQLTEPDTLLPVGLKENGPKVLEDDIASPAELAKAYMGMSSRIAPSPLGLRGQSFGEDVHLSRTPFPLKSPSLSIVPRSAFHFPSNPVVPENSYRTPARQGRSAIYNMARTPYSRVSRHTSLKGVESMSGANVVPLSPQWSGDSSGGKQVSKRRSSVLDNDIGSVGPIRRIRQKTNLVSPFKSGGLATLGTPLLGPATAASTDPVLGSASSNWKPPPTSEPKHSTSSHRPVENLDRSKPDMRFDSVPSQSNDMARKILEQLDKLVPSPRERSSDLKLATSVGKPPAKLTPSMLQGQALRSMEDVDSSKLLYNMPNADSSNGFSGAHLPGSQDLNPQTQIRAKENGPSKASSLGVKFSSEPNGPVVKSVKETLQSDNAGSAINSVSNLSQKKQGFKISAHEDFLEFDDNTEKETEKLGLSTSVSKANGNAIAVVEHGISSETRPIEVSTSTKTNDVKISEGLPPPNILLKEAAAAPVFSGIKASPFTFSSASPSSESLSLKFGVQTDSKLGTSPSTAPKMAEPTPTAAETNKGDKDKSVETGNLTTREDSSSFSPVKSTTPLFSFGASLNNSAPKKDSLPSSGSSFSSPSTSATPSGWCSTLVSSASTNAATAVSISSASPPTIPAPLFPFGSSTSAVASPISAPLTSSTSALSTTPELKPKETSINSTSALSTTSELKAKETSFGSTSALSTTPELKAKETSFSSQASPLFGSSSSALAGTGNGPFAFGSSAPSASASTTPANANNIFQSFNAANASSGSLSSTQEPATGTGNSLFSQNMPLQFGSTACTPIFGASGSSSFSSGGSLFSSSSSSASAFGTSSVFGTTSMSSSGVSSFSFGAGTPSSILGSSSQPSFSSIFGSTSSGVFPFGMSSGPASAAGSAPTLFGSSIGSSSGSMFSFTSSATTANAPPPSPVFPTFGSTPPVATALGSASPANDQMNMEDSMAEDTSPAPNSVVPIFGQPANTAPAPSNITFGSPMPSAGAALFQFGAQQNSLTPQTPSPFQAPGNFEYSGGGSFSLGTGDKSTRKFIKASRSKSRKR